MDISVFISDLLFEHDCVMVPGFGGFICNYRPAEIHPVLHYVNPPSKSVSFNVNLNSNDGLLVNAIAQTGSISFDAALDLVNSWVESSKSLLRKNETVILNRIGRVFSDIEGNIQFAPDESVNYLKASFALKPITAQPVLRGKEVDFTEKFTYETKKRKQESVIWKIAAILVVLLSIGGLLKMMHLGIGIKPLDLSEANIFSGLTRFDTQHEVQLKPLPLPVETSAVEIVPSVPAAQHGALVEVKTSPKVVAAQGYYIIIGAFSQDKNAETARRNLASKYPNTNLFFEKSGGLTRVGYAAGNNNQAAEEQLLTAKAENPGCWILRK